MISLFCNEHARRRDDRHRLGSWLWPLLLLLLGRPASPRSAAPPKVLFIAIDDLNDWIGCLGGHPQAHTPHYDWLAKRGVLCTNAHCAARGSGLAKRPRPTAERPRPVHHSAETTNNR